MRMTGLSAFPMTPILDDTVDEAAFARLVDRLRAAGVDSITALGSTGSYMYLTREERARVARIAVDHAGDVPVIVGVGALRTAHVLDHVADAHDAGAAGILLAPVTYQPLTADDVFELFRTVNERSDLPIIVYDNPGTTHFSFTPDLYGRIAELPRVVSIKIPAVPSDPAHAAEHVATIRSTVPDDVTIGVSGDASAATGLSAGCDVWYSVIGGTLPDLAVAITTGSRATRTAESARLQPLWDLFARFGGSLRVVAAIAEELGLVRRPSLPLPILGLTDDERAEVSRVLSVLDLM